MTKFFVHNTSVVDGTSTIGENTKIWHYSHIMQNCLIGKNCIIGQNVFVSDGIKIGNNVKIQNNVSIFKGVICEDDVFIGPSAVFTNVINPRSFVERKTEFKTTRLNTGCTIGANSTIICGINIGKYALIGAGSVVTKNVKNFEIVVGNPAKHLGWISIHGEKLEFNKNNVATCKSTNKKYRLQDNQVSLDEQS